jgi:hypothetical protein
MDLAKLAQELIDKLVAEAQKAEALTVRSIHQAEGVKLLFDSINAAMAEEAPAEVDKPTEA